MRAVILSKRTGTCRPSRLMTYMAATTGRASGSCLTLWRRARAEASREGDARLNRAIWGSRGRARSTRPLCWRAAACLVEMDTGYGHQWSAELYAGQVGGGAQS